MAPLRRSTHKNRSKRKASLLPHPILNKKNNQIVDGRKFAWLTRSTKKKQQHPSFFEEQDDTVDRSQVQWQGKPEQAQWLSDQFKSALGSVLSSLELEPIPDGSIVQLSQTRDHRTEDLVLHMKEIFYQSWEETLCKGNPHKDKRHQSEVGSPTLLIICSSANRCVELLRGMRIFCSKCKPVKLFAKHIKIEEQIEALKGWVNIGAGTPNRIKKLMDLGALNLSRLEIVLTDMKKDAKGLTLFTVPEVRDEFWDLYKTYIHARVLVQKSKICLY